MSQLPAPLTVHVTNRHACRTLMSLNPIAPPPYLIMSLTSHLPFTPFALQLLWHHSRLNQWDDSDEAIMQGPGARAAAVTSATKSKVSECRVRSTAHT